jgi:hypothetical protein
MTTISAKNSVDFGASRGNEYLTVININKEMQIIDHQLSQLP